MHIKEVVILGMTLLGGLSVFIFAMAIMTDGLRTAAGPFLRQILKSATKGRIRGMALGTFMGLMVQSTATTVMLVGFIQAGLISLAAAIPPIIGANVGTTLSMQAIAFHVGDYWYLPVIPAAFIRIFSKRKELQQLSMVGIGFGLLFLGMNIMGDCMKPYREVFAPWLTQVNGHTLAGIFIGLAISATFTSLVHSSGATIGICFALIKAGVFTDISQVFPLILGAHIGTCITAMLASIGACPEARRSALAHLVFNLLSAAIAISFASLYYKYLPRLSPDLLRQTANLHTIVQLSAGIILLPFTTLLAKAITLVTPSRKEEPETSYLDDSLQTTPERAIYASMLELRRVARIGARSFRLNVELAYEMDKAKVAIIRRDEDVIDEIQRSMKQYLAALTRKNLSRRQALLIQHLIRCMTDIERIGDHNDNLCYLSVERHRDPKARLPREALEKLFTLFTSAEKVLRFVIQSLDPDMKEFQTQARLILQARDEYVEQSLSIKSFFMEKVASHEYSPITGIYLSDYVSEMDRIVRHSKNIALVESQPHFWIKRKKLDKTAQDLQEPAEPPPENGQDFLDKLQSEGFV